MSYARPVRIQGESLSSGKSLVEEQEIDATNQTDIIVSGSEEEIASRLLGALAFARQVDEIASRGNASDFYCKASEGVGLDIQYGHGSLTKYSPLISFPRMRRDQLRRVDYWLEEDDFFERLVSTKVDFTSIGMTLRPSEEVSTGKDNSAEATDFERNLERIKKKWNWPKLTEDLLRDWFSKDTMILYWKIDTTKPGESDTPPEERSKEELMPGLLEICALNPTSCDWENSFGQDELKYFIPRELTVKIQNALNRQQPERAKAIKALKDAGVEQKYFDAVDKGRDYVILSKEDGDNWIITTKARKRSGLARPSACAIFMPLEIRKMLSEGEFSAAFLMKHFILHVTAGESITQGPMAGQKTNWAKQKDIENLDIMLKKTAKAQRVVSNHTVKFTFVFPPKEMWDRAKYENSETRMLNWAGVTIVLMSGTGGTNASGYLGIRRMISSMRVARDKIDLLFFEFFDNPQIREITEIPDDVDVKTVFDENVLKEPRQLLDEIKTLVQEGIHDPSIALAELGRDPATVRAAKQKSIQENEESQVWEPVYRKDARNREGERQDRQSGRGRPASAGTTADEGTRSQSPPASGSPN